MFSRLPRPPTRRAGLRPNARVDRLPTAAVEELDRVGPESSTIRAAAARAGTGANDLLGIQVPAAHRDLVLLSQYAGWPTGAGLHTLVEETVDPGTPDPAGA